MISAQTLRVCREGKPVPNFPDHALKPGRDLIVVDGYAGPGTRNFTPELARPVLVCGLRGRKPQHGGVVRLHLHPCSMRATREDAVNAWQVVAGPIEQQMMLEMIVDV